MRVPYYIGDLKRDPNLENTEVDPQPKTSTLFRQAVSLRSGGGFSRVPSLGRSGIGDFQGTLPTEEHYRGLKK